MGSSVLSFRFLCFFVAHVRDQQCGHLICSSLPFPILPRSRSSHIARLASPAFRCGKLLLPNAGSPPSPLGRHAVSIGRRRSHMFPPSYAYSPLFGLCVSANQSLDRALVLSKHHLGGSNKTGPILTLAAGSPCRWPLLSSHPVPRLDAAGTSGSSGYLFLPSCIVSQQPKIRG